jgi:DNA replication protein DnaC
MATAIELILKEITEKGLFQKIERFPCLPFNMNVALSVVEAIGKERNSKFRIDNENRFVYENLIRWVHADPEFKCMDPFTRQITQGRLDKGIYLSGNTGSGKSWAIEIMSAYSTIDNVRFSVFGAKKQLHWPCIRTDTICEDYATTGTIEKYKKMSIIGIQDLGAEPPESLFMGNRQNVLQQILESRGDQTNLLTIITSNLPINHEALTRRYQDRVASRLNEMCNYFELTGNDRRKT